MCLNFWTPYDKNNDSNDKNNDSNDKNNDSNDKNNDSTGFWLLQCQNCSLCFLSQF